MKFLNLLFLLLLIATTVFQQLFAAAINNESNPRLATACTHVDENITAARIFGKWQSHSELSSLFAPGLVGGQVTMTLEQDATALSRFNDSYGCAYAAGVLSMSIKIGSLVYISGSSPFMLVSENGNPSLVIAENLHFDGEFIEHPHSDYAILAPAPDPENDLLFLGKHIGGDFVPLRRME